MDTPHAIVSSLTHRLQPACDLLFTPLHCCCVFELNRGQLKAIFSYAGPLFVSDSVINTLKKAHRDRVREDERCAVPVQLFSFWIPHGARAATRKVTSLAEHATYNGNVNNGVARFQRRQRITRRLILDSRSTPSAKKSFCSKCRLMRPWHAR